MTHNSVSAPCLGRLASLASLVLLVACERGSPLVAPKLQAMSFVSSEWSEPVNLGAPVNSAASDMNPALSPDELSIYFVSTRAGGQGNADIWVSRRASLDSPWGEPVNLGPNVNGPGIDASPLVSLDGHLLWFSSDRAGGQGQNDIYVARRSDTNDDLAWGPAVPLGPDVNTAAFEAGEFYLQSGEDGPDNLYFSRGPNSVALDIYVAPVRADGETLGPAVLVTELSDLDPAITDAHPSVRVDGREIYFYSNRAGSLGASDLWRSTRRSVHEPWSTPEHLAAPLNTTANEIQPTLSYSGRTLVFASTRAGGLGNSDIWMSTRTPSGH
jgi:Tol biopolymer transport system component